MTREEAIEIIQHIYDVCLSDELREAFPIVIEALEAEAVQGCDGCRYNTRTPQEQCLRCKRYWKDSYERKGGEDE